MQFKCDRCGQEFNIPDEWSGRRIRCKGCNRVLSVPEPDDPTLGSSINVGALAHVDDEANEDLVTDFAPIPLASSKDAMKGKGDQEERKCPHCGKMIKADRYSEVLCSGCWKPVPPEEGEVSVVVDEDTRAERHRRKTLAFYDEAVGVFGYPMGGAGSIMVGMLIAGGAILLPVGMILMFTMGVSLNPISEKADLSWVSYVLAAMFLAEAFYFSGVAYAGLLDAARLTISENDKAPELSWNLASASAGIISYLTLALVYGVVFALVNYLVSGGKVIVPTSMAEVQQLRSPVSIVMLALLTFSVPMAIIGLASGPGLSGLSPGRIIRSISATLVHYLFLFIVVCVVLGLYLGIMSAVIGWASEAVTTVLRHGVDKGLDKLGLGLLAWTILIGTGFYCAIMMGRLHGLFARSFRGSLAFDF